jgi:hypothetical protein
VKAEQILDACKDFGLSPEAGVKSRQRCLNRLALILVILKSKRSNRHRLIFFSIWHLTFIIFFNKGQPKTGAVISGRFQLVCCSAPARWLFGATFFWVRNFWTVLNSFDQSFLFSLKPFSSGSFLLQAPQ